MSPDPEPKVSVVIPTCNNARLLGETLDSVMQQANESFEVIVVDDGSTDDTAGTVARYGEKARYIFQENEGPSSARNRGLDLVRGKFVIFMDSDDLMLPAKISDHLRVLEADASLDFCHSGWQLVDADKALLETIEPWRRSPVLDLEGCLNCHPFYLPAIMFRASTLRNAGGFQHHLRQAEDIDFILRLMLQGAKAVWLRRPTILYRQHRNSLTRRTRERVESVNQVFGAFFSRPDLPSNVAGLENHIRYNILMWSVWELYRNGERDAVPFYLQKSCTFFEGSKKEILQSWIGMMLKMTDEDRQKECRYDLKGFLPLCKAAIEMGENCNSGTAND